MTLHELEQQLVDLQDTVAKLSETMVTMHQQIHTLAHKLVDVEARVDSPAATPFRFPR